MRDLTKLPEPVVRRLLEAGHDVTARGRFTAVQRGQVLEARPWASVEVRAANDDGTVPFVGYSTSYERPYDVYGGPEMGGWSEVMAVNSWKRTIDDQDDIRLLINHDGIPLARTRSGTLRLTNDDLGVLNEAPGLDVSSPNVASVISAMRRGDMDQMSCAFRVLEQSWSPDYNERRILQVQGFDSSIVTYPANEATLALVGAGVRGATAAEVGQSAIGLRLAREQWASAARRPARSGS